MADIKTSALFSKGTNKAMDKIRGARLNQIVDKVDVEDQQENMDKKNILTSSSRSRGRNVGAPITRFDKVYKTTQPIKLSILSNATLRILSEKYMAGNSKDEILRKALDSFIQSTLASEDRQALLADVEKELVLFRKKNPTEPEIDHNVGVTVRTIEAIEKQTLDDLKEKWKAK